MGGLNKTNTATQSTAPPAQVQAQYQQLLQRASGQSQNGQAPYAPFNANENSAFGSFGQIPGQFLPQAEQYATEGSAPITGGQIANYSNPFQQDVINATEANINETNAEQQNQITGNAIAQGALGGNRVGVAQGELARQQGLANNSTLAGLNAANYSQALQAAQADREAKARGAGLEGNLQTQAIQGSTAELGAGTVQQDYANQQLQWPYQNLDWLSQIEGRTGPLEGSTTTQKTPGPSILSQIAGAGLALAGLPGSSLGGGFLKNIFGSGGGQASSPTWIPGVGFGGVYANGGGISVRPRFAEGGIAVPPSDPSDMIANAFAMARALKAGMGGIGAQHFDGGGTVGTMVSPFAGFDDSWGLPAPVSPGPPATRPPMGPTPITPIGWTATGSAPAGGIGTSGSTSPVTAALAAASQPPDPSTATMGDASGSAGATAAAPSQGRALNVPLIAAGLGMMASQSPFLGTAIGEGGLAGVKTYQDQLTQERQLAQLKNEADYRNRSLDLESERLDQSAKYQSAQLALAGSKYQRVGTDASGLPIYAPVDAAGNPIGPPSTGSPTGGVDVNAQAGDTYNALPKPQQGIVDSMLDGRLPVPSGTALRTPYWQNLIAAANDKEIAAGNPKGFDATNWAQRLAVKKEFSAGSANLPAGTITAGNTAIQHLGHLYESVDKLGNFNGVPFANYALNLGKQAVAKASGQASSLQEFNSIRNKYVEEATKFYRGTGGSEADISRDIATLDSANSPQELKAAIKSQVGLMMSKVNALQSRWQYVFGDNSTFPIIQPESQKYIDEINGATPEASGSSSAAAAPPPTVSAAPTQYPAAKQAPDGNWYVPNPAGGYFMVAP